jgi:spore coat protein A, manganese oxidase
MITRRRFIQSGAAAVGVAAFARAPKLWPFAQSPRGLAKFVQPLPQFGVDIPFARPTQSTAAYDLYEADLVQTTHQFHPALPPSTIRAISPKRTNPAYLSGFTLARRNRPIRYRFTNRLPVDHILPVDDTVDGAAGLPHNRTAIHLHGHFVDWTSDGGVHHWFDAAGHYGPSVDPLIKRAPGQVEHYYPNQQNARPQILHDHSIAITRQNVYSGLLTGYVIRDSIEDALVAAGVIPSREIPLIIQDKTFVDGTDPAYVWGKRGDLWYPYQYESGEVPGSCEVDPKGRWDLGSCATPPGATVAGLPMPSCVAEGFMDTAVVNGAAFPYLEVEQRHYRFRIFNAANARFLNLMLYYASTSDPTEIDLVGTPDGLTIPAPTAKPGPRIIQIGNEAGLLPRPVKFNDPPTPCAFDASPGPTNGNCVAYSLLMAPGERADVVIDFSGVPAGARLILYTDAPAPFPGGDSRNDYYAGCPDQGAIGGAASTPPGYGPNTRTLMQFRVVARTGAPDPAAMSLLERLAVQGGKTAAATASALIPVPAAIDLARVTRIRNVTLNEDFDDYGRLIQMMGTDVVYEKNTQGLDTFGRPYSSAPTESPRVGDVEIWRVYNTTGDTHPVHLHLADVQVLSRRPFTYTIDPRGRLAPTFTGPARGPDPNESGYKDVVRMNPGEVTEIVVRWALPAVPFPIPVSQRLLREYGVSGYEYMWHCHILEHEDHDMMRPIAVLP